VNRISGRLLATIAYRHLLEPRRHLPECAKQCAKGCPVYDFHVALNEPVLQSEIEAARREEERFKALAAGARG
jgi:hypothetical protein